MTMGVGRNAALAPNEPPPKPRGSSPSQVAVREGPSQAPPRVEERPPSRPNLDGTSAPTARRGQDSVEEAPTAKRDAVVEAALAAASAPKSVDPADLPTVEIRKDQLASVASDLRARGGRGARRGATRAGGERAGEDAGAAVGRLGRRRVARVVRRVGRRREGRGARAQGARRARADGASARGARGERAAQRRR